MFVRRVSYGFFSQAGERLGIGIVSKHRGGKQGPGTTTEGNPVVAGFPSVVFYCLRLYIII